ncbi:MAG: phosphonate C-P lyase system protein PhnL [Pseudomonadota bacterium]|jgi:alpha-D-ribose 1-methylphosphonate 5-triphosphate synthase subunit PhnL|uniref:Alpha-D-ribose 1-methylphosphonate 5-triphosphate synthase subunit PhnL n=1 Tax=Pseudooceanicola nitratireducens TaxID=517719 RepID=A0A1I1KXQ3_9RHOB|nr:phosphonate C-P lyase system protein PhnL [Pseudooceanicola nitratireducens]MEC7298853.1 phosphonate C-P lyase system protein PhnL [Pseudomonadota bacterium]MBY6165579.1 phosphonate C-P lyase system protein PhnL [Pseudooceanicola nitratireducens]MEC7793421.1 phosphonate C-P lyase system protein PhnL [Pseudomonadota bacterium]MEC8668851.1 phosphonate C-P lyase system protein PhnL [Pseudomonadota bacterium]SEJ43907.1 alpha-D-ribose 1-methylphosphonate 5-triphosphate synthase subunit PhnL [Pse
MIRIENLSKTFTLHNQGGAVIPVMTGAELAVAKGECIALTGASGAGKSTLMRMIYGNYLAASGHIWVGEVDVAAANPREILELRRHTLGYVSQFLRVVPRVPTLEVVAEPLLSVGVAKEAALERARDLLGRLNIPETLWSLSPTTFSGGEQQRVNIARGFAHDYPALLLDEPTASLDATNREVVLALIEEAKARGAAIIGIFHDEAARDRVCDRVIDVTGYAPPRAA